MVLIGAGPAGLTAAYELSKHHVPCILLERDAVVGGLARTVEYKGYLFDIGGHRFYTKIPAVEQIWREVLGDDLLLRPRLSRIHYRSKLFRYPLEPLNALAGLGPVEAARCAFSFLAARAFPDRPEENFEAWVSNRFGRRLFEIFFKTYTEKVWGIPCREIGAEWAAQRIRGLSLPSMIWNAIRGNGSAQPIRTLIHEFHYPRRGPGMMWNRTREIVESRSCRLLLDTPVERILWDQGGVRAVRAGGKLYTGDHFISSMAIRELIKCLDPAPPPEVRQAVNDFHYRDFLTIALIVRDDNPFSDNWIYVHDPNVQVGRIQNYKNWSPEMTPDAQNTCLGLEYFCSEGDKLWNMPDAKLIALGRRELAQLGLAEAHSFLDGKVVRVQKAYPVYDQNYQRGLRAVRDFLKCVPNLQLVGRNGMHRYNNQDHSMLTAMLAVRNVLGAKYDLWQINVDAEYHEQGVPVTEQQIKHLELTQPFVPRRIAST